MKRIYVSLLTCILFIPTGSATALTPSLVNSIPLVATETNREKIRQIAQEITVKIVVGDTSGSGVIIAKNGQTYTVITNAHVITRSKTYRIQTPDGNSYDATLKVQGSSLEGNDLALLEFTSPNTYTVATLGDGGTLEKDETIYSAGFPFEDNQLTFSSGKVTLMAEKPLKGGYQIGYTNVTEIGMSGGALLNAEGKLIGIVGMGMGAILDDAYSYQDGTIPNQETVAKLRNSSFAVPIQTLISVVPDSEIIPPEWKTGLNIAEKVDRIAQQITVRIDASDGSNGSGVIIGKKGTTYYVATACHVVTVTTGSLCKKENVQNKNFTLVTPDGEKYIIERENILTSEGIDAAIIQFTSQKSYQVATIANYDTNFYDKQWIFVSGFPKQLKGTRKFTTGVRFERQRGFILAQDYTNLVLKDENKKDIVGFELIYSNLSEGGMSGGAVLDTSGQLIGINGGVETRETVEVAENITLTDTTAESKKEEIYLGYSTGVPSSSLLTLTKQKNIPQDILIITDTPVPKLTETEITGLKLHSSFVVEKPSSNANAGEWLNYGSQLWRLGQYNEAISAIQQALNLKPNFYQAYYALGLVYSSQKKDAEALNAFEKSINIEPDYYYAWEEKASTLSYLDKYEEAVAAIDKTIELKGKEDFRLYMWRGYYLFRLGRFSEAEQALNRSIEIYPNNTVALAFLCMYSFYIIADEKKLEYCNKAIELLPDYPSLYFSRGLVFFNMGNKQGGSTDLDKIIKLEPNAENYQKSATLRFQIRDNQGAVKDITKAIELEPNNAEFYYNRSTYQEALGNPSESLSDINKAIELQPKAGYYQQRATIRSIFFQDQKGAIADLNQAIILMPNFGFAYFLRGLIKSQLSDYEGAESDHTMALNLANQQPEFWFGETLHLLKDTVKDDLPSLYTKRAEVRVKLKKYPEALSDFNEAIKLAPDEASIYVTRGDYYTVLNQPDNAKSDYQKALELFSKDIEINPNDLSIRNTVNVFSRELAFIKRANVREKLQDYQGAIEDYSQAIKINPYQSIHYAQRGDVRKKLQDYQGAIEDYSQAIEINPKNFIYYIGRALVRRDIKDYQGAMEDISEAIKLKPNDPIFYAARGEIRREIKDYQAALEDYTKALELDPNNQNYQKALEYCRSQLQTINQQ